MSAGADVAVSTGRRGNRYASEPQEGRARRRDRRVGLLGGWVHVGHGTLRAIDRTTDFGKPDARHA
jgi:hypothetical protein